MSRPDSNANPPNTNLPRTKSNVSSTATGDEEITSTYRTIYGGPRGASASSWTSRSSLGSPSISQTSTPHMSRGNSFLSPDRQNSINALPGIDRTASSTLSASAVASDLIQESSGKGGMVSPGFLAERMERVALADDNEEAESLLQYTTTEDAVAKAEAAILAARQQLKSSLRHQQETRHETAPATVSQLKYEHDAQQEDELKQLQALQEEQDSLLRRTGQALGERRTSPGSMPDNTDRTNSDAHDIATNDSPVSNHYYGEDHSYRNSSSSKWSSPSTSSSPHTSAPSNVTGPRHIVDTSASKTPATNTTPLDAMMTLQLNSKEVGSPLHVSQAALDAANLVQAQISALKSGNNEQQIEAARGLAHNIQKHGEPVQSAAQAMGAVHVLHSLLAEPQPTTFNAHIKEHRQEAEEECIHALAELCKYGPARDEVLSSAPGAANSLVQLGMKGIPDGKESSTDLLVSLILSRNDQVAAASAQHKLVRLLTNVLAASPEESTTPSASKSAALGTLHALCTVDPGLNIRKLAWSGSLPSLVPFITSATEVSSSTDPDGTSTQSKRATQASMALNILLQTLMHDARYADALCSPETIQALASVLADPEYSLSIQAGSAVILSLVSALPSRKEDATMALTDWALPRACEILHHADAEWNSAGQWGGSMSSSSLILVLDMVRQSLRAINMDRSNGRGGNGGSSRRRNDDVISSVDAADTAVLTMHLHAACASLTANLASASALCCHVIIFHHTQLLQTLVNVLVGSHQYALVDRLLSATEVYAAKPSAAYL